MSRQHDVRYSRLFNRPGPCSIAGIGIGFAVADLSIPAIQGTLSPPVIAAILLLAPLVIVVCVRYCVYREECGELEDRGQKPQAAVPQPEV